MKNLLLIIALAFTTAVNAQSPTGLKASWEDRDGRGFTITIPEGKVTYTRYDDDSFEYDREGRIIKISDFYISRDRDGNITQIGDVYISYDSKGNVTVIGGMYIIYDREGRYLRREGKINNY